MSNTRIIAHTWFIIIIQRKQHKDVGLSATTTGRSVGSPREHWVLLVTRGWSPTGVLPHSLGTSALRRAPSFHVQEPGWHLLTGRGWGHAVLLGMRMPCSRVSEAAACTGPFKVARRRPAGCTSRHLAVGQLLLGLSSEPFVGAPASLGEGCGGLRRIAAPLGL